MLVVAFSYSISIFDAKEEGKEGSK